MIISSCIPLLKLVLLTAGMGSHSNAKSDLYLKMKRNMFFFVTALTGSGKGVGGGGGSMTEALRTLGTSNFLDPSSLGP